MSLYRHSLPRLGEQVFVTDDGLETANASRMSHEDPDASAMPGGCRGTHHRHIADICRYVSHEL